MIVVADRMLYPFWGNDRSSNYMCVVSFSPPSSPVVVGTIGKFGGHIGPNLVTRCKAISEMPW